MGVKNHSGIVEQVSTWTNSHGEFEVELYSENGKFLWHFAEDESVGTLESGKFYCPIYSKEEGGRSIRKSSHLFYILVAEDDDGDTLFMEIGPDGFVNRAYQDTETLERDISEGHLLPMWRVSSFGTSPEEAIPELKKLRL